MTPLLPSDWAAIRFEDPRWLAGLYVLPLIVLLYFLRRPASPMVVAHLPLWQRVLASRRRRASLLRRLLELACWLAAFASAILFAAAPYEKRSLPGAGHTVVILDGSLGTAMESGDGRSLASGVRRRAEELALLAAAAGPVSLGVWNDSVRLLRTATRESALLREALAEVPLPSGGRNFAALEELAASAHPESRFVLVTPFEPPSGWTPPSRMFSAGAPWEDGAAPDRGNGGIVSVGLEGEDALLVGVDGGGGRRIVLRAGGSKLAEVPVPDGAGFREIRIPRARSLPRDVQAALEPLDGFPLDDGAELALPPADRRAVLVAAAGPTPFLDAWLSSSSLVDRERSGRVEPGRLRAALQGSRYDAVILVDDEQSLPLPPGDYILLGATAPDLPMAVDGTERPAEPVSVAKGDPLVAGLDFLGWTAEGMRRRVLRGAGDVLVDGTRGPLLARYRSGAVRVLDVAVGPDPAASTLPLLPAFPVLLDRALEEYRPSRAVAVPPVHRMGGVAHLLAGEEPVLESAGGERIPLVPDPDGRGHRLPEIPGRFEAGGADARRPLTVACLDHPGRPGAWLERSAPPFEFPAREERADLRPLLAALLALALLAEGLLRASGGDP